MPDRRPLLVIVGRQVKQEREAQGMMQTTLAERAGMRVALLREIEHGRGNPAFPALDRLVRVGLRIPLSDLIAAAEREASNELPEHAQ